MVQTFKKSINVLKSNMGEINPFKLFTSCNNAKLNFQILGVICRMLLIATKSFKKLNFF